jgi:hypothetical protein
MNTDNLECDGGCGRFVFGYHDDTADKIRIRAARDRGWLIFDHKDLCNVCRRSADALTRSDP